MEEVGKGWSDGDSRVADSDSRGEKPVRDVMNPLGLAIIALPGLLSLGADLTVCRLVRS